MISRTECTAKSKADFAWNLTTATENLLLYPAKIFLKPEISKANAFLSSNDMIDLEQGENLVLASSK